MPSSRATTGAKKMDRRKKNRAGRYARTRTYRTYTVREIQDKRTYQLHNHTHCNYISIAVCLLCFLLRLPLMRNREHNQFEVVKWLCVCKLTIHAFCTPHTYMPLAIDISIAHHFAISLRSANGNRCNQSHHHSPVVCALGGPTRAGNFNYYSNG